MHCDLRMFFAHTLECSSPMRLYALVTVALFVLFKCLVSSMHICLYICMGVETLDVLFKCIESSMHRRLCICMGVETLTVLFKRLESSMHRRLYICMGVETLVVFFLSV